MAMVKLHGKLTNGTEARYGGYRLSARFDRKITIGGDDATVESIVPTEKSMALEPPGTFSLELADEEEIAGDVLVVVISPDGERLLEKKQSTDSLAEELALRVAPKDVHAVEEHPDPNLARPARVTGLVLDLEGKTRIAGRQVVLWGKRKEAPGEGFLAVDTAITDRDGYFAIEKPQGSFVEAFGQVAAGNRQPVPIRLESEEFPPHLLFAIEVESPDATGDLCACETTVPRAPSLEELTTSGSYSQDLGGQCTTFNVPNRTLEEFSFYTVVRTTEPQIKGLTLDDPPRLKPDRVMPVLTGAMERRLASRETATTAPALVARERSVLDVSTRTGEGETETTAAAPLVRSLDPSALKDVLTDPDRLTPARVAEAQKNTVYHDVRHLLDLYKKPVPGRGPLNANNPIDWDDEPTFYQAATIAHGHLLHFKQVWKADGYSLGDLLYSLPLAPCQKKQIAIVDWERREIAARTEMLEEEEHLAAVLTRDRDISEIVNTTLTERTRGGSSANAWGVGGGIGGFIPIAGVGGVLFGAGGGGGGASSSAWQNSSRTFAGNSLQQLRDRTMQSASAVRSQRSTVVQTSTQGETMRVQTEVVANHNHCHATTMQYFEVLRHFLVQQQLAGVQECLFVPLLMTPFTNAKALRWREPLSRALRDRSLRGAFAAIDRIANDYAGSDLPTGRYSEETVTDLQGEMRISMTITRPPDDKDEFDPSQWRAISLLMATSLDYWYNLYLRGQAEKDRQFRLNVAPRVAEKLVQTLRFYGVGRGSTLQQVDLDPTLVSNYTEGVPLYVSLRSRGTLPLWKREEMQRFLVRATHELPPYSRVIVHSAAVRYRTRHMNHFLFREPRVMDDLSTTDDVLIATPLDRAELRNPRQEDRELAARLIAHLNEHLEYYHRSIWLSMNPERRYMLLDGFLAPNANGRSVASVVENRLLGIVGNCLILPVARGFNLDPTYQVQESDDKTVDLLHHYAPLTPVPPMRVSVPTRGVFAESVMGSCNSCEEKDDTRFWRFEESPCGDEPTPIAPVSTESRRGDLPDLTAKPFPAPMINLQNAPAAPDPTGLAASLKLLGTPDLFKDITGLAGNQANAIGALTTSLNAAQFFGAEAGKLATQQSLSNNMDKTLRTIQRAESDGLITREQAAQLAETALRGSIGEGPPPADQLTDNAEVKDLLRSTLDSDDAQVALTSGPETVSVVRKGEVLPPEGTPGPFTVGSMEHKEFLSHPIRINDTVSIRNHAFLRSVWRSTGATGPAAREIKEFGEGLFRLVLRQDPGNALRFQIPLNLLIHFPADPGDPTKLVPGADRFPVVVIAHGQHGSFVYHWRAPVVTGSGFTTSKYLADSIDEVRNHAGYSYFQEHLASRGIVSASVDVNLPNHFGSRVRFRAEMIVHALRALGRLDGDAASIFHNRLDMKNIGLLGHSRGGDAVIKVAHDNRTAVGADKLDIKAVGAIAPTDFTFGSGRVLALMSTDPLMLVILSGTHDGDVSGIAGGKSFTGHGFRHYDRATCPKVYVFGRGLTHNRFNRTWDNLKDNGDFSHRHVSDASDPPIDPEIQDVAAHESLVIDYFGALFDSALRGDHSRRGLLNGTTDNTAAVPVALQWSFGSAVRPIDEFERTRNLLNATVVVPAPGKKVKMVEAQVGGKRIEHFVHHQTTVAQIEAPTAAPANPVLRQDIPPASSDFSSFELLTVRLTRWFDLETLRDQSSIDSVAFPKFKIRLKDDGGASAEVDDSVVDGDTLLGPNRPVFQDISIQSIIGDQVDVVTKLVLETLQVRLSRFTGIDLAKIKTLEIEFDKTSDATVFVDSLMLVKP